MFYGKSNKKDYLKGSFRRKYVLEILLKFLVTWTKRVMKLCK